MLQMLMLRVMEALSFPVPPVYGHWEELQRTCLLRQTGIRNMMGAAKVSIPCGALPGLPEEPLPILSGRKPDSPALQPTEWYRLL